MKFSKNVSNKKCATKFNFFNEKKCFWKLQFLKHLRHFLLKLCPFFVSWFWSFGKKYENDLRIIFDQWPQLSLGLDVLPEIPILKVIWYICNTYSITSSNYHRIYKIQLGVYSSHCMEGPLACYVSKVTLSFLINISKNKPRVRYS